MCRLQERNSNNVESIPRIKWSNKKLKKKFCFVCTFQSFVLTSFSPNPLGNFDWKHFSKAMGIGRKNWDCFLRDATNTNEVKTNLA